MVGGGEGLPLGDPVGIPDGDADGICFIIADNVAAATHAIAASLHARNTTDNFVPTDKNLP